MNTQTEVHRRPVKWSDEAVIEQMGLNLECILELTNKTVESLATKSDVPLPYVQSCMAGTVKNPNMDHLQAMAAEFEITDLELLAHASDTEKMRESHWRIYLESKGLIKEEKGEGESGDASDTVESLNQGTISTAPDDISDIGRADDKGPTIQDDLHLCEPVLEGEFSVKLGEQTYDLIDKSTRGSLVLHIRAAAKAKGLTLKALAENAGLEKASSWFSTVEKGTSRITSAEVEALAKACDTTVGILLTGFGLDLRRVNHHSSGEVPALFSNLPTISPSDWEDYFKSRIISTNVKLAEGVEPSRLMDVVLRDQSGQPVDWAAEFLDITKLGGEVQARIDRVVESLGNVADVVKVLVLKEAVRKVWPNE